MKNVNQTVELLLGKLDTWGDYIVLLLPNLLLALILLYITFNLSSFVRDWVSRFMNRFSYSAALSNLILTLLHIGMLLLGFFLALIVLSLDNVVVSLLAGVGIVGIALGFAFKDIAANFFAGVIIALNRPFRVGQTIMTNDYFGTIESISLRTMDIRQETGEVVKLPNKTVFENPVTNFSFYGTRRIDLEVGVSYAEGLNNVQQVVTEALQEVNSRAKTRDVEVMYDAYGDSSVNIKVRFWITYHQETDYESAKSDAIIRIKKAFDANGILITFPIRTIDFGIKGGQNLTEQLHAVKPYFRSGKSKPLNER